MVGEVERSHAGLRAELQFDGDTGIDEDAIEHLADRFRGRLQSIAGRPVRSREHQRQPVAPFSRSCSACALAFAASG